MFNRTSASIYLTVASVPKVLTVTCNSQECSLTKTMDCLSLLKIPHVINKKKLAYSLFLEKCSNILSFTHTPHIKGQDSHNRWVVTNMQTEVRKQFKVPPCEVLAPYNAAPHNRYQPHPAVPALHTTCSNTRLVLLKMGIMMPETC